MRSRLALNLWCRTACFARQRGNLPRNGPWHASQYVGESLPRPVCLVAAWPFCYCFQAFFGHESPVGLSEQQGRAGDHIRDSQKRCRSISDLAHGSLSLGARVLSARWAGDRVCASQWLAGTTTQHVEWVGTCHALCTRVPRNAAAVRNSPAQLACTLLLALSWRASSGGTSHRPTNTFLRHSLHESLSGSLRTTVRCPLCRDATSTDSA